VIPRYKVYDCFLYNGERELLEIRFQELNDVVDCFVIVEAVTTHSGLPKVLTFDPFQPHIAQFLSKVRYIVVRDMPQTCNPQERKYWQRNAVLRGIPDAAADDLVLLSDVDEIPSAAVIREINQDNVYRAFGFELALYCFFLDYRNVDGPQAVNTSAVAARKGILDSVSPSEIRHGIRRRTIDARILSHAGWHFSCLMDEGSIRRKIALYSNQDLQNAAPLDTIDIRTMAREGKDLFGRPGRQWDLVGWEELPSCIRSNAKRWSRLFYQRANAPNWIERLKSVPIGRPFKSKARSAVKRPVIICPYVQSNEVDEIAAKFGLKEARGRKLKFFLWQDTAKIGPEHAFEHCWNLFPDRDIIIIHSDMAPMPEDRSNRWYDELLEYRASLPNAGMIGCNLFYPRFEPGERLSVQCAGGTFESGKIGHIVGPVCSADDPAAEGIREETLQAVRMVDWVTFGGILIRRELLNACGRFDRRYKWAYVMDVDYCFEARLRGFRLFQVPIQLQHEENRTTLKVVKDSHELHRHILKNSELFYEKWSQLAGVLLPIG
jgi:hypothetical protein